MGWIEEVQTEEDPAHFISESVLPQLTFSIARPKAWPLTHGKKLHVESHQAGSLSLVLLIRNF